MTYLHLTDTWVSFIRYYCPFYFGRLFYQYHSIYVNHQHPKLHVWLFPSSPPNDLSVHSNALETALGTLIAVTSRLVRIPPDRQTHLNFLSIQNQEKVIFVQLSIDKVPENIMLADIIAIHKFIVPNIFCVCEVSNILGAESLSQKWMRELEIQTDTLFQIHIQTRFIQHNTITFTVN